MAVKFGFNSQAFKGLIVFLVIVGAIFYWRLGAEKFPGAMNVKKGHYALEDGLLNDAEKAFKEALLEAPDNAGAHLGLALTYMQSGRNVEAMPLLNKSIELAPDVAIAYADRGILYDRLGEYELALQDYQKSLNMDEKMVEGPGFLWRFMRNISEKPPEIKDRADYLAKELGKPEEERLLKVVAEDAKQVMHKKSL